MKFFILTVFAVGFASAVPAFLSTKTNPEVYKPVGECPPVDGQYPVYLADSENRSVFYECSNGVPYKQVCPDGLVFKPNSPNVCVWPDSLSQPIGQCPETDPQVPVILPDGDNCAVYYVCFQGQPFRSVCPEGLLFNAEMSYCDFPANVNCPTREEPTEEPTDEPAEEPSDEPAEEPSDEPAEEPAEEPEDNDNDNDNDNE